MGNHCHIAQGHARVAVGRSTVHTARTLFLNLSDFKGFVNFIPVF